MKEASGTPAGETRCVVRGMNGFLALKTLKTSAITSTRETRQKGNSRLTLRFNCENGARRLQFTVSHGPISSNVATPESFSPV